GETPTTKSVSVTLPNGNTTSETLTLGTFLPAIPAGATITSAILKVRHQDNAGINTAAVTVMPGGGLPAFSPAGVTVGTTMHEDDINVTSNLLNSAAFSGLSVAYTATVPNKNTPSTTDALDGINLDVTYTPL